MLIFLTEQIFTEKNVFCQKRNFNVTLGNQKKRPAATAQTQPKNFNIGKNKKLKIKKNKNSRIGRNELEITFSHILGDDSNDFDNEMMPNT